MERLVRFFVERHLLVHVGVAAVIVMGLISAMRSPSEGFPNVTVPLLIARAELPGASARDVETKVTIPLEEAIEEIDDVDSFHTVINDHQSVTTIELYDDLNDKGIREAEQDLREAIDAITDFPPEMEDEPTVRRVESAKFPVLEIALSGPSQELPAAARRLERALRRVPDVATINLVGLRDPEVRVLVDPIVAREHGVTLLDVVNAVERRNVSSTGGVLETETERRQVVLWSRFEEPADVGHTVLRFDADGGALRLSDVARIEVDREDTGLLAHTNGRPGISLVVLKRSKADIIESVDAVMAAVEQTPLPPGVETVFVNDESFLTRNRLQLMANNGLIGVTFVAAIIFLFLSPSAAIWVLIGVPVVILGVLLLIPWVGMTLNLIALGGFVVVLGMLVDDAVVVSERILRRRQQGLGAAEAAVEGALAVARPVIASAITTVLAFLPMFALGGIPGRIAWNIPAVVILALILSLIESFLVLPAHMSIERGGAPAPKRAFVVRMEVAYERVLRWVLPRRRGVVAAFVALLLFTMIAIRPLLGFVLFPQDDAASLAIKVSTPLGTPIEQTEGVVTALEEQLPALVGADLVGVTARIGHQESDAVEREHGGAENEAVIIAYLQPTGLQYTAAEWAVRLRETLRVPPDVDLIFEPEILGPPLGRPITVHIAGNQDEARRATAGSVAGYLRTLDALVDVEVDERPGIRQIDLNLDYERLALRALQAEDVGLTLRAAFYGLEASEHRDLEDTTKYRVMLEPSGRRAIDGLLETPVRNGRGELVQIRDVVQPIEIPAVSRIYHREGVRCATVTANIRPDRGETAASFAARLEADLLPRFADRGDVEVYLGGEIVETRETTSDLGTVALLSLFGIGTVIAVMLGSFLEAVLVVSVVPFAVVGVLITFFLHGQDLSLFAMIGTIGLAGVVVNASIVMVDAVHQRLAELGSDDPELRSEAVIQAVVARLRPILVTSASTLVAVLPTAYGVGGHDAVLSPMSLALGWGLAFSTLITLFLVPSLYSVAGDLRALGARLRRGLSRRPARDLGALPEATTRSEGPASGLDLS